VIELHSTLSASRRGALQADANSASDTFDEKTIVVAGTLGSLLTHSSTRRR
jgi:hypothetical protein